MTKEAESNEYEYVYYNYDEGIKNTYDKMILISNSYYI